MPFHAMSSFFYVSGKYMYLAHVDTFDFLSSKFKIIMALAHANENYSEIKICVNS